MARKFSSLSFNAKNTFIDILKSIKWQLIISALIILIGFIIGIYSAFSFLPAEICDENQLLSFLCGSMSSFSSLVYRIISSIIVMLLLFLFSKSKWLSPLAVILLFYRAYLLGINIGMMLRFYSVSGIIVAVIILFPMHLVELFFFAIFYFALLSKNSCFVLTSSKKFILISLAIVLIINIATSILLIIFSPNVILIL